MLNFINGSVFSFKTGDEQVTEVSVGVPAGIKTWGDLMDSNFKVAAYYEGVDEYPAENIDYGVIKPKINTKVVLHFQSDTFPINAFI